MLRPALVVVLVLLVSTAASAQSLALPFEGRWFVYQGGDTPNVNHHGGPQAYGIDFVKVGGPSNRQLSSVPKPQALEDFYSWDASVLSPADGVVVAVVNDLPDNPLGTKDPQRPAGNHVVIKLADDRYVYLAHLRRGSVRVSAGDTVKRGQLLGKCGNSGNSDFPHLHLHIQDTATLNVGRGLNPFFGPIDVELTGKLFTSVDWPMIRGLFVRNP